MVVAHSFDTPLHTWDSPDRLSWLQQGDSLQLIASLSDNSIDCIWTDPPYLLSNDGITCIGGKMVEVNKGEWDRSHGIDSDHELNLTWLRECYRVLKPTGTIWITGTVHIYLSVGMAMQQTGFRILNDIVWVKPAPPPNLGRRCFTHASEMILWGTKAQKGKDRYIFHYDEMRAENGGKQMQNIWRFAPPGKAEKTFGKHPTQKPTMLVERCLRASTNAGDIVLDPFSGSATTGVAALHLKRRFIGFEKEKDFVSLAIKRLSAISVPSDYEYSSVKPSFFTIHTPSLFEV
jgi:site-specific DNA-methyltransferase (adenine-specific)